MTVRLLHGDCREVLLTLPDASVHCCVTSPPYWGLRDYGVGGQIGLESSVNDWVDEMVAVFREVRRVLRDDGTLWLNLGDSYATGTTSDRSATASGKHGYWENPAVNKRINGREIGLKPKDLIGQPWRVAFALQADGWWLRQDIIWHKPNPMPESVTDRCTKAHEYLFLLSKSERYYYDGDAIRQRMTKAGLLDFAKRSRANSFARTTATEGPPGAPKQHRADREDVQYGADGANKRSVWTVATEPFKEAHFATFPPALIEPCIKAGCPVGGTVLDPFGGAGTTGLVADRLQRDALLIELNPAYIDIARRRIATDAPLLAQIEA